MTIAEQHAIDSLDEVYAEVNELLLGDEDILHTDSNGFED